MHQYESELRRLAISEARASARPRLRKYGVASVCAPRPPVRDWLVVSRDQYQTLRDIEKRASRRQDNTRQKREERARDIVLRTRFADKTAVADHAVWLLDHGVVEDDIPKRLDVSANYARLLLRERGRTVEIDAGLAMDRLYYEARQEHAFLLECEGLRARQIGPRIGVNPSYVPKLLRKFAHKMRAAMWRAKFKIESVGA